MARVNCYFRFQVPEHDENIARSRLFLRIVEHNIQQSDIQGLVIRFICIFASEALFLFCLHSARFLLQVEYIIFIDFVKAHSQILHIWTRLSDSGALKSRRTSCNHRIFVSSPPTIGSGTTKFFARKDCLHRTTFRRYRSNKEQSLLARANLSYGKTRWTK